MVDKSESEAESGTNLAEGSIKEEKETLPAGSMEIIPDSTTIHMESLVTSTHSRGLDTISNLQFIVTLCSVSTVYVLKA